MTSFVFTHLWVETVETVETPGPSSSARCSRMSVPPLMMQQRISAISQCKTQNKTTWLVAFTNLFIKISRNSFCDIHTSGVWLNTFGSQFPSIACAVRVLGFAHSVFFVGFLAWATTEQWWHRKLRKFRSLARVGLRSDLWKTWPKQKLIKAFRVLQQHHGSRLPKRFLSVMSQRIANLQTSSMWTCRFCQLKHTCAQTHCESCNRHWKQADAASGPRSQSRRSRRPTKSTNESKKPIEQQSMDTARNGRAATAEEDVFSSKLPWVTNSPHARAPPGEGKSSTVEENTAMPVPPEAKTAPAPTQAGEEDVANLHQHLKGLKAASGALPVELEEKLVQCEDKLRERTLSHGHLNRLGKLNKQMKSLMVKIQSMDEGWQKFAKQVADKFEEHRKMFHSSRELLYLVKAQELQQAKQEVQLASQHLFAEVPAVPPPGTEEETAMMMQQALQEDAMFGEAQFDEYQDGSHPITVEDDELMEEATHAKSLTKSAVHPFTRRVAASPTKVAQLHLKAKETEKGKASPIQK